jgi:lipoic acid synthetase
VLAARPNVLNHNTETVPRLYRSVRPGSRYERSLAMLAHAKQVAPDIPTKSGVMVGLGETDDEIIEVMRDLRRHHVDIFTLGQYLRPSRDHLPIQRYCSPEQFARFKQAGMEIGFKHVESGPLVRSSYHADESAAAGARLNAGVFRPLAKGTP